MVTTSRIFFAVRCRTPLCHPFEVIRTSHLLIHKVNFSRFSRNASASQIAHALKDDGCVVVQKLFSRQQIDKFNKDIDKALANIKPGKPAAQVPGSSIPDDEAIFGKNTKRIDRLIRHSPTWREMLDEDALHGISKECLRQTGDYWLNTATLIEIGPDSAQGPLHADASLWYMLLGLDDHAAPELVLNFLIATTPTTIKNGATGIVEGSHKLPLLRTLSDPEAEMWKTPDEQVKQIELDAGDCLLLGGRIFHRGGANTTPNEYRRVLSCMVTSSALTPEEAHYPDIDSTMATGLSHRAKKFLGLESMLASLGAGFWRIK